MIHIINMFGKLHGFKKFRIRTKIVFLRSLYYELSNWKTYRCASNKFLNIFAKFTQILFRYIEFYLVKYEKNRTENYFKCRLL